MGMLFTSLVMFLSTKKKTTIEILGKLNGRLIVVRGNHDSRTQLKKFERDELIDSWHDYLELDHDGTKICMMHYPITCWNKQHHGSAMLHGHSHGSFVGEGKILDVGLDSAYNIFRDHRYFSIDEVMKQVSSKEVVVKDHHEKRNKE